MKDRPEINTRDWISVKGTQCVVTKVREPNSIFGDCEVVFDSSKPTNRNVRWNGSEWEFVETGDFGGYADKYDRLRPYVAILKQN